MRESVRATAWVAASGLILALGLLFGCGGSDEQMEPLVGPVAADSAAVDPAGPDLLPLDDLPPQEELDRIVAEVNGTSIRYRQVYEVSEVNKLRMESEAGVTFSEQGEETLRRQALNLIIDGELMIQAAREQGMTVDPEKVEQQFQQVRGQFGSDEDFRDYLTNAGMNEEQVREEAERRLLAQAYQNTRAGGISVDDAELRRFYEAKPELFQEGGEVRAAYILIRTAPEDPASRREEARKRIEEAYQRIGNGEDFAQIAMEYSQAPNAAKGGDLGFFPRGMMFPRFEDLAFKTPIGEVTEIFETPSGYNVIKVLDRKEPETRPFEEVKPALTALFSQQYQRGALRERLDELRETATITILDETFLAEPEGQQPAAGEQG